MPETSRDKILSKLGRARAKAPIAPSDFSVLTDINLSPSEKIASYRQVTESVNTEVHELSWGKLVTKLKELVAAHGIESLMHGALANWQGLDIGIACETYDQDIEACKERLFSVDASLTLARGAIAQTGSLILWPSREEPRLLSLTPPIHIAVVEANSFYSTFHEAMTKESWAEDMPTNPLLISGPSKTADIEQELCYGVHGPKQLIVLIVT